jgi:hypothetical protein
MSRGTGAQKITLPNGKTVSQWPVNVAPYFRLDVDTKAGGFFYDVYRFLTREGRGRPQAEFNWRPQLHPPPGHARFRAAPLSSGPHPLRDRPLSVQRTQLIAFGLLLTADAPPLKLLTLARCRALCEPEPQLAPPP